MDLYGIFSFSAFWETSLPYLVLTLHDKEGFGQLKVLRDLKTVEV